MRRETIFCGLTVFFEAFSYFFFARRYINRPVRQLEQKYNPVYDITDLAAPNGFDRELAAVELANLGEERGLGLADPLFARGMSSSLRRVS